MMSHNGMSGRQLQGGAVAHGWLSVSPVILGSSFWPWARCFMITRWLLQLQAPSPYTTMFKARCGEWIAMGNLLPDFSSWSETFPRSPQTDFLFFIGGNLGTWLPLAAREDGKDSMWQSAVASPCWFKPIVIYLLGLGRSPQSLNSRAVHLLPEQSSSSGFC